MRREWSDIENDVVVDAYLRMLRLELAREPYVKKDQNQEVQRKTGRSRGSVEFKLQNVSAVLREMDFPTIRGYRPYVNFQKSLRDAVIRAMKRSDDLVPIALESLSESVRSDVAVDFKWHVIPPPVMEFSRDQEFLQAARRVDFTQLEYQNRRLGVAGERIVAHRERLRLTTVGRGDLAEKVEHVSLTQGDGMGYDVLSYNDDGQEKYIEVKTTRLGPYWPSIVTRNEVEFSEVESDRFELHRVFAFNEKKSTAGLYILEGAISNSFSLDPTEFKAIPRNVVRAG